jgi:hypothetical protein
VKCHTFGHEISLDGIVKNRSRWALVQAGRAEPSSYLGLIDGLSADDGRAVWDQVITSFGAFNRLSRDRAERSALQASARARRGQAAVRRLSAASTPTAPRDHMPDRYIAACTI